MLPIKLIAAAIAAAAAGAAPGPVQAQQYPSKPVTVLIGFSPGGTLDTIGRLYAAQLEKTFKQPVIVENRLGGGGLVAATALAKSPPDGYLVGFGGNWVSELFVKDLPYDNKDIAPITVVGQSPYALIVSKKTNSKTLAEFLSYAKANAGKLDFGVVPSSSHESEMSEAMYVLGIKGNVVGYKGIAPIYTALVADEIHGTLGSGAPQVKSGQLLALAQGGEKRSPDMPNVPTFRELGINYDPVANYVLWGRSGIPKDVADRLAAVSADLIKSPEFKQRVTDPFNIQGRGSSADDAVKIMRDEYEKTKRAVERAGIKRQ